MIGYKINIEKKLMTFPKPTLNMFSFILEQEGMFPTPGGDLSFGMPGKFHQAF